MMATGDLTDIDYQLQTCVQNYEDALNDYWAERLNADDWTEVNQLRRDAQVIAEMLRERALALQNVGDTSALNSLYKMTQAEVAAAKARFEELANQLRTKLKPDDAQELLAVIKPMLMQGAEPEESTDRPLHLVWQYLCIRDACAAADGLRSRVGRIFVLEQLVQQLRRDSALPDETIQFLALVGRTFVWGFDAECVIVCRGAIDTAFRDKVPISLLESRRKKDPNRDYGLQDRIEAACPHLISEQLRKDAHTVRCRGDKAIHFSPNATRDVLGTIRLALSVIDCLAVHPNMEGRTGESSAL